VASAVGAVVAGLIVLGATNALGHGHAGSVVGLLAGGVIGLAVIGALAWRMRIPEVQDVVRLARGGESARP
jgi:putative peptidoglycan lipid II flippase